MTVSTDGAGATPEVAVSSKVSQILVSETAFRSEDAAELVAEVVRFVNRMMQQGAYLREELPHSAFLSYHVDYYLAQVSNGGHGQFVGNSRWHELTIRDIEEGLRLMQAAPYVEIFQDLKKLIEADPARARAIAEGGGFGKIDPAIEALDARYFAQDAYKVLTPANANWLRGLPEVKVIPDADYPRQLETLIKSNPKRSQRVAERNRAALRTKLTDPLHVAARMLCFEARRLPVLSIPAGDPGAVAPDGRRTTGWGVNTPTGHHTLFIFDDIAQLCERFLADGSKVTPAVMAATREALSQGKMDFENYAKITHKEIARVETQKIHEAISVARNSPIIAAAEMALGRLKPADRVEDVWAATKTKAGQWLWQIMGAKGGYLMVFAGKEVLLTDMAMKPLTSVLARDLIPTAAARQEACPPGEIGVLTFLFSFKGRVGRWPYLVATTILGMIAATYLSLMLAPEILWKGAKGIPGGKAEVSHLMALAPMLPIGWMQFALATKRLHDLGFSFWHLGKQWIYVTLYSFLAPPMLRIAKKEPSSWNVAIALLTYLMFVILVGYLLWLLIKMMCFSGDPWANRFGAGPLKPILRPSREASS